MSKNRGRLQRHSMALYVIRQPASGLVKVGVTDNLEERLRSLQHDTGQQLEVLATYDIRDMETHCHKLGASHRMLGEWFAPEILDLLLAWLPKREGRPFLSRCEMCRQWFRAKGGTGKICGAELCRRAQARKVGEEAAKNPHRPLRQWPPSRVKVSHCAVCGDQLERRGPGRPRVLCDKAECRHEYGVRFGRKNPGWVQPPQKQCTVDGCEKLSEHIIRGMCPTHYQRWRKHGDEHWTRPISQGARGRPNCVICDRALANTQRILCGAVQCSRAYGVAFQWARELGRRELTA